MGRNGCAAPSQLWVHKSGSSRSQPVETVASGRRSTFFRNLRAISVNSLQKREKKAAYGCEKSLELAGLEFALCGACYTHSEISDMRIKRVYELPLLAYRFLFLGSSALDSNIGLGFAVYPNWR